MLKRAFSLSLVLREFSQTWKILYGLTASIYYYIVKKKDFRPPGKLRDFRGKREYLAFHERNSMSEVLAL